MGKSTINGDLNSYVLAMLNYQRVNHHEFLMANYGKPPFF
jgi:hypothetical protein